MTSRSIKHILDSEHLEMGPMSVKQPLPKGDLRRVSPFILLHHFGPKSAPPGTDPLDLGGHPHRGFEPVTFLYDGGIRHRDSLGNEGTLSAGDVQWMTAGKGIVHSEKASPEFLEKGGTLEGIQLWVNLPRAYKMIEPGYQDIPAGKIPKVEKQGVSVEVVAGAYENQQGPAKTQTAILALKVNFSEEAKLEIPIPKGFNAMGYLLSGELNFPEGEKARAEQMIIFHNEGEGVSLKGAPGTRLLFLAGEPIDEPLATYGPFVMNSQAELWDAIRDYQSGEMGILEEGIS
jgi:redox-sensitive bicupin YhaK (pirin superfamily)